VPDDSTCAGDVAEEETVAGAVAAAVDEFGGPTVVVRTLQLSSWARTTAPTGSSSTPGSGRGYKT